MAAVVEASTPFVVKASMSQAEMRQVFEDALQALKQDPHFTAQAKQRTSSSTHINIAYNGSVGIGCTSFGANATGLGCKSFGGNATGAGCVSVGGTASGRGAVQVDATLSNHPDI